MSTTIQQFRKLHQQQEPFLLGNAWDAQSARVFESLRYKAIGTSSAAVAEALGYEDGENMPFEEYLFVIKRIKASTSLPFTVDLEGGYGTTPQEVVKNIRHLASIGVAGINIEDSVVNAKGRTILSATTFAEKLTEITRRLRNDNINLFINVRCDAWLLGLPNAKEEAINRIAHYEKAGADGIFVPCITNPSDIQAVVNVSGLPVNVMCMPDLPEFSTLQALGVRRISMGSFLNMDVNKTLAIQAKAIADEGSFAPLFQMEGV